LHDRRYEDHAYQRRVDEDRDGEAEAEDVEDPQWVVDDKRGENAHHDSGRSGDDAGGGGQPLGDGT
jgi:hypothetical protein